MIRENFVVEVAKDSGFIVGDVVETITPIQFREGFVLDKGLVICLDEDPGHKLLALHFAVGLKTHVRSPLPLNSLSKVCNFDVKKWMLSLLQTNEDENEAKVQNGKQDG